MRGGREEDERKNADEKGVAGSLIKVLYRNNEARASQLPLHKKYYKLKSMWKSTFYGGNRMYEAIGKRRYPFTKMSITARRWKIEPRRMKICQTAW